MTQSADIRRRADGSIDTEYHMDRARQLRSMELSALASAGGSAMVRLLFVRLHRMRVNWASAMLRRPEKAVRFPGAARH
jgi:hypothetical protein